MAATSFITQDNQVPNLENYNLFDCDPALRDVLQQFGSATSIESCRRYGGKLGSADILRKAQLANEQTPEAAIYTRTGERQDAIRFTSAWHELLGMLFAEGVHASAWEDGQHVQRAALFYQHAQTEAGSLCPVTMTFASIAALRDQPIFSSLAPLLFSREYDPADAPLAGKRSMMIGMGMTERQGGSDVRTNTTRATPEGMHDGLPLYSLHGQKWFFSSPMSDAHLVLAYTQSQLGCFYVPRWRPDGQKNSVHIRRLKNKLGNRSNASAEVDFDGAWGVRIGREDDGLSTILRMVNQTRLDCVLGSAGLLRQGLVQALHHARHRVVFGKRLADQPLMQSVLCDLALESEAGLWLGMSLAHAVTQADDPLQQAYLRIVSPAAKFWVCKRAIAALAECLEVWGGNGYIEDCPLPRLLREAPVNSIWEGSGNVMCLDVLRAMSRQPDAANALLTQLAREVAGEAPLVAAASELSRLLAQDETALQAQARNIAQRMVLLVQAALLLRYAPQEMVQAFILSRFPFGSGVMGTVAQPVADKILQRAYSAG